MASGAEISGRLEFLFSLPTMEGDLNNWENNPKNQRGPKAANWKTWDYISDKHYQEGVYNECEKAECYNFDRQSQKDKDRFENCVNHSYCERDDESGHKAVNMNAGDDIGDREND